MSDRVEFDKSKINEFKKVIEEKIEHLKKELEFYEFILSVIEGRFSGSKQRAESESVVIRDSTGTAIATLNYSRNKLRIVPNLSIRINNHLFNTFLLKFLEEKKSGISNVISNYEIRTDKSGYITEIVINGNIDEILLTEIQGAMKFLAEKYKEIK